MPELPEVETIRRSLLPELVGQRIMHVRYNRPNIRFPLPVNMPAQVEGLMIQDLQRRGKYLLMQVEGAGDVLIHLGMSGRVLISKNPSPLMGEGAPAKPKAKQGAHEGDGLTSPPSPVSFADTLSHQGRGEFTAGEFYYDIPRHVKHDHVVFELAPPSLRGPSDLTRGDEAIQPEDSGLLCSARNDGAKHLIYNDPRRFGVIDFIPLGQNAPHKLLENMGLEPWDDVCTGIWLFEISRNRSTNLKAFLLDQTIIAGIGNIYASEALHLVRLSPFRAAGSLNHQEAERLMDAVRGVLEKAITLGGSTIRDFQNSDGTQGSMQDEFLVYGRNGQPCLQCNGMIEKAAQNGRSTFWCGLCQI